MSKERTLRVSHWFYGPNNDKILTKTCDPYRRVVSNLMSNRAQTQNCSSTPAKESIQLNLTAQNKLNTFHYNKGLRQILHKNTTYTNRANANEVLLREARKIAPKT